MINNNTKIYLDMDGVLADFFGVWSEKAGVKNWKDIPADQVNTILDDMVGTDFFNTLPKFPTADTLVDLAKSYTGEYHINSSPLRNDHENSGQWKKVWIKRELSTQPKTIILTNTKEKYAVNPDGSANILIDDRGANIQAWAHAGGIGLKYQADENTIAELRAKLDKVFNITPGQDPKLTEGKIRKHPEEDGAYLLDYNGKEYKIAKFLNNNLRHTGEWSIFQLENNKWEWEDTVTGRNYAIDRIRQMNEDTLELRVIDPKLPNWKEPKKPTKHQKRKALTKQYNKTVKEDPELNDVEVSLHGDAKKGYVLSKIAVPKELRNTGIGSKVMNDLTDKADAEGAIIALTPDNTYGGSKTRLTQFYKRFGFVPNKGRNKDFRYRETMIRYPITEDIDYTRPDFDSEWEEAIRYPQFKKMGKEAWIDLASSGRIININDALSNLMYNTDAGEKFRNTWHELDTDKKKRFVQALDKERVELPIIARWPDGGLELIGGNTRLTGLMLNKGEAKAWIFNA